MIQRGCPTLSRFVRKGGECFVLMPRKLRRYHGRGDLHFITFSCYERRALLARVRARDLCLKILEEVRKRFRPRVVGYVVMPEHVHFLIGEPQRGTLPKVVQVFKQRVSRRMRAKRTGTAQGQLSLAFANVSAMLRRFWQRRYYDFNVYSSKKIREKLDYMHRNPVQRKLVSHPKDWPWSSWRFYAYGEVGVVKIEPPE